MRKGKRNRKRIAALAAAAGIAAGSLQSAGSLDQVQALGFPGYFYEGMEIMNGIDISNWQNDINLWAVDADFVICKASGGTAWKDRMFDSFARTTLATGRKLGFYHFAREAVCRGTPQQEALHFYQTVRPYLELGIPVLDFEDEALTQGPDWAEAFLDTFYQFSGVKCLVYTSAYYARSLNWSRVASKGYQLWLAQYATSDPTIGYLDRPWTDGKGVGAFGSWVMLQYSGNGRIPGFEGRSVDLDQFYGNLQDWNNLSRSVGQVPAVAMHRLYNPNSGEHFYTASASEKAFLVREGWNDEGIGWYAPSHGDPVYRLYNINAGDHHYTTNAAEKDKLIQEGWTYEGIGWHSSLLQEQPIYRSYNPNAKAGSHNFSADLLEYFFLEREGWDSEGIAWYGLKSNIPLHLQDKTSQSDQPAADSESPDASAPSDMEANEGASAKAGYDDPAWIEQKDELIETEQKSADEQ